MKNSRDVLPGLFTLAVFVLIAELAGALGSLFTVPAIPEWYALLEKPFFTPPNWVFGPVWIALYFLMGISAFLVWQKGSKRAEVKKALGVFFLQLFLNVLWTFIFFGLHNPFLAFLEILILLAFIVLTVLLFWKLSRVAAFLLFPYLFWVAFAAVLNFAVWQLNL